MAQKRRCAFDFQQGTPHAAPRAFRAATASTSVSDAAETNYLPSHQVFGQLRPVGINYGPDLKRLSFSRRQLMIVEVRSSTPICSTLPGAKEARSSTLAAIVRGILGWVRCFRCAERDSVTHGYLTRWRSVRTGAQGLRVRSSGRCRARSSCSAGQRGPVPRGEKCVGCTKTTVRAAAPGYLSGRLVPKAERPLLGSGPFPEPTAGAPGQADSGRWPVTRGIRLVDPNVYGESASLRAVVRRQVGHA